MDKKKMEFVVFCMEYYEKKEGLLGSEVYELFSHYGVVDYFESGYDVLYTQGKDWLMNDIDVFLKNSGYCKK